MRRRLTLLAALVAVAAAPVAAETGEHVSTLADQRGVGVTIYNGDLAVVRDRRRIALPRGETHLAVRDVSARMIPETAVLQSLDAGAPLNVVEQNFDYDLLSPQKLLEKYVGRDVDVIHDPQHSGAPRRRERARVLAANNGVVLRYADRIETTVDGQLAYPSIPPNLRDRPTLVTTIESDRTSNGDLELDYLTGGLSWQADYTALLSANDDRVDLHGLVTLRNASGTSYRDASVQLVAGNINVARSLQQIGRTADTYALPAPAPTPREEALLEYHLYTLPRRTTIADAQTKQVELLSAAAIPVRKTLELRGGGGYYRSASSDLGQRIPIGTYLSFTNTPPTLGMPLPGGTIRVYKRDSSGTSQFVGSDNIPHTPRNDQLRLFLGSAFDLVANKRQTDYHVVGVNSSESAYSITILNGKSTPQDVLVVETIPGDWTILQSSAPYVKTSASTATWTIRVPGDGQTVLTYRARVTW